MASDFRSGDALFGLGRDLRILFWNAAAEELTGIPTDDAVGRPCWDVLGGIDGKGDLVCHAGCSSARLALKGWPVSPQQLNVKTSRGRRPVTLSTIAVRNSDEPVILHLLRNGEELPSENEPPLREPPPTLTPRQLEVLSLLGEGTPAKVIARRFGIAETTVRNHIRLLLAELGCHSQLEALAKARRLRLIA